MSRSSDEVREITADSMWQHFKLLFSNTIYVIAGVIGLLLLVTVVAVVVILTGGGNSGDVAIDYSKALLVSDERDLWALDLDSQKKIKLVKSSRGIAAFDLYNKDTIYWREVGSSWVNSLSTKFHNLTQAREWDPNSIAVDFVTHKVYVLDGYAGKVNVYDPKSTKFGIAVSDLKNPVDIDLDHARGLMFIVQKSDSILKGNMDGTYFQKIVVSLGVTALCVDTQTPKLYWSDLMTIESSDYDGNNRLTVATVSSTTMSLGVSGNRLFWTRPPINSNVRTLWSCTTTNGVCSESDFQQISFDDPKAIKVYTGEVPSIKNPCEDSNGGCEQLCLLTANGGHTCACYVGYQLKDESYNCEPVKEYIMYAREEFFRGRILDDKKQSFSDAILPIRFHTAVLNNKRTIDFDYNFYTRTIVFSDDHSINTVDLTHEEPQGIYNRDNCIRDVSFDWVTNDVHYVKDNCDTAENTTLVILRPKENTYFWKTLQTFHYSAGHPTSLVVHPNNGCQYFTMLYKNEGRIYKKCGLKLTPFLSDETVFVNETGLAIDHEVDRLYWFNPTATELLSATLEGSDVKSIDISAVCHPKSVSIYGRYAYVANLTSIWRFDKSTGSGLRRLSPMLEDDSNELIAGVKIFGQLVQKVKSDNPCAVENGNCEQFCVRTPRIIIGESRTMNVTGEVQKICECEDYKSIQDDGRSCTDRYG
ncbi:low-density lipoprotein receptor-related protein 2-like [Nasonia vitripennis]|uniref:Vitellogenin receptor n=1 Tax=Nasonia vitripennis TaxID=7425 RepID=A0A7M7IU79_NASVI|nr:low-density lipoprotein receptor-related protein 2-like [Nasonia vitripennis]